MNYDHSYHAGTFSDVVKHVILTMLIHSVSRKSTGFCYLDTHAGLAYYDLFSTKAAKTKEYQNGIEKIIQQDNPPPEIKLYLDCIHQINNELIGTGFTSLRYYPGSTMIARYFIRAHDRIIACELQPDTYRTLKNMFDGDKQVAVHHLDGFLSLKAFLPPPERRGLILIDPPYEDPDEFTRIAHSLPIALKKWPNGIYAIWFPIKEKSRILNFYRTLQSSFDQPILAIELTIFPDLPQHLNGCGVAIINPPWQFETNLKKILPWLWNALTINGQGYFSASPLK